MTMIFDRDLFEINPDCRIQPRLIGQGQHLLVEVDDVLAHPLEVRNWLELLPQQSAIRPAGERPPGFYPGYQTYIQYDFFHVNRLIDQLLDQYFGHRLKSPKWSYQTVDTAQPVYKQSCYPHADSGVIAANIFLNSHQELEGRVSGTGFYRFKQTNEEQPFPSPCLYKKQLYGYANPDMTMSSLRPIAEDDQWQQYHISEQRWNRLNIYEGMLFHMVYFDKNSWGEYPRRSLSMID